MQNDLTVSSIDRQNILNNPFAVEEIKKNLNLKGIEYNGRIVVLKEQVADFFEVSIRTIENYIAQNENELRNNGYEVLRGKSLNDMKLAIKEQDVTEINFGNIKMVPQLGIFDFRAFLNLAMLLAESEKARILRQVILDIAIDTINQRTGGGTKYNAPLSLCRFGIFVLWKSKRIDSVLISNFQLPTSNFQLQTSNFKLQTSNFKLQKRPRPRKRNNHY